MYVLIDLFLFVVFSHDISMNFHDPWLGTNTPEHGESVFALRFSGKPVEILTSKKHTPW